MDFTWAIGHAVMRGTCSALLLASAAPAAQANWLAKLARGAGEAGSEATRFEAIGLARAAAYLERLPATAKGSALAAHATPVNRRFSNTLPSDIETPIRRIFIWFHAARQIRRIVRTHRASILPRQPVRHLLNWRP